MSHYQQQILACDFFTIETVRLQTLSVLFFIEVGTRRVHLAGCTSTPSSAWVTQQARQLVWSLADHQPPIHFLIHDRDTKFSQTLDTVFVAEGIDIQLTPVQSPNVNAFAGDHRERRRLRWVRSVRQECLDQLLILNERHLHGVLTTSINHYNVARPVPDNLLIHSKITCLLIKWDWMCLLAVAGSDAYKKTPYFSHSISNGLSLTK